MLLVGLTGGIGSGKTTLARMLKRRGAVVVDADDLARQAVEPGSRGFSLVASTFGAGAVDASGHVDRRWLAGLVFADEEARRRLEEIVHPEVARLFTEAVAPYRDGDRVVVYVVPLLVEKGMQDGFDVVVSVTAPEEVRRARVLSERGGDAADVAARMASQLPEHERNRAADVVVVNRGSLHDLEHQADLLWERLRSRARADGPAVTTRPRGPAAP